MTPAINAVNDQAAKATHPQLCVISKVPFFNCKPRDCLGYYIAMINTYHCLLCQLFVYFHLPEYYCCNTRSGEVIPLRIPSRKRYPGFSLTQPRPQGFSLKWVGRKFETLTSTRRRKIRNCQIIDDKKNSSTLKLRRITVCISSWSRRVLDFFREECCIRAICLPRRTR